MAKPRIHEIAHQLGVPPKTLLAFMRKHGEFFKSASSSVEPPVARRVRRLWEAEGRSFNPFAMPSAAPRGPVPDAVRKDRATGSGSQPTAESSVPVPQLRGLSQRLWLPELMPETIDELLHLLHGFALKRPGISLLAAAARTREFLFVGSGNGAAIQRAATHSLESVTPGGIAYLAESEQLLFWHGELCGVATWKHLCSGAADARLRPLAGPSNPASFLRALSALRVSAAPRSELADHSDRHTSSGAEISDKRVPTTVLSFRALTPPREHDPDRAPREVHRKHPGHRWNVSGHFRQQWYPSSQSHEQIWIKPHVSGPKQAPLVTVDRVQVFRGARQPGQAS